MSTIIQAGDATNQAGDATNQSSWGMKYNKVLFRMQLPQDVYLWLVALQVVPNAGEQDDRGVVSLPPALAAAFHSGLALADLIRKVAASNSTAVPPSLAALKQDSSRTTKLTNWNFIWLALEEIGLRLDPRIRELILQGEHALIVELLRQLHERDAHKPPEASKPTIRIRQAVKPIKQQQVDVKKLNLSKNPEDSDTSLEFLMLLLKASLGMSVEEILGLFTNQNKYLAQVIVKGVNDNFEPIILFYTLLIKHKDKLKSFYGQDAEACLFALKPAFISKSEKVVALAIELFGSLENIYSWFIGEGTATTFFLGLKRHPSLKTKFWNLLTNIIKDEEVPFFTKFYPRSFQSEVEQVEVTTIMIELLPESELLDSLMDIGILSSWLQVAVGLREDDTEAQIIAFRFVGELMLFLPDFVEQNEDSLSVFQRDWHGKSLPAFATLLNELVVILQRLGEEHNAIASRIYQCLTAVARAVGPGDKRDYLVENFIPLVSKFPNIPTEYLLQHLKGTQLSNAEFLLVCECIEINHSSKTQVVVGGLLKGLFIENPLLNFYLGPMLKEIVQKVIKNMDDGPAFIEKLVEDVLHFHATLQIKYKSKTKHQSISFGKRDTSDKASKQEETELTIKQKWKEIVIGFVMSIVSVAANEQNEALRESIKLKLLNSNNHIKLNAFKVGCRAIEDVLAKKFSLTKEQQHENFEEYSKRTAAELSESAIRSHKPISHVTIVSRLKGPENLTKEFQQMTEKRRQEEEERRIQELKRKAMEEKKRLSVKKELEITNLLRGQIGEAQLREEGFLERLMQEPKELEVIPASEIEERELEAIETTFKKYHKVLRHLFLTYTWTMYNGHANEKFEDNQQRKEILTVVELGRMLKDYRLAFLTNQTEVSGLVRDISLRLMGRREVAELDFAGFEQFIVQYCALVMTRNHTVTITTADTKTVSANQYKNQPLHVIVREFFSYLKGVFAARGEKTNLFDDAPEGNLTKEQTEELEAYTKKVESRPDYILPKGFKKVPESTIKFNYNISQNLSNVSEAYTTAIEVLDEIFSQKPFNFHLIESLSEKTTIIKVKPTLLNPSGLHKERAMSTYIEKPVKAKDFAKRRSSSRGITVGLQNPMSQRNLKEEAAAVLEDIIEKVEAGKEKEQAKQKKLQSMLKLQEIEKSKQEAAAKKLRDKEEQRQAAAQKEKEAELKRRQQTERFLEEQRIKLAEKRRKNEEQEQRKRAQEEEKEAQKRENMEKFRSFHQGQVQKIKKIEETALEKIRKERVQLEESREQREEQRKRLKSQIEEEDRRIIDQRKDTEKKIQALFESEPIRKVLSRFEPNLRGVFDFLVQNTYLSLTEKKHNHEVVFESWRAFLTGFEITAFSVPKDTAFIFKTLTKPKLASKDYYLGLTFPEFQLALLRIAIKYKTLLNLIADRIKDEPEAKPGDPKEQTGQKEEKKEQNEFEAINENTIKDILRENLAGKEAGEEYGDVSGATDRTLLGLIYYLKVPRSKQGQERRFREILERKHPSFAHQADWLREKLNEEYTLEQPKRMSQSRVAATSQVSIK